MSLWTDVQRLKEIAVVFVAALVVGFGLGRRRYIEKMPRYKR